MKIRVANCDDAAACACIYAPYVRDTVVSFELEPPDAEAMRRRMAETMAHYPWLVAEEEGVVAGYAYAGRHAPPAAYQWSADVTIYLDAAFHRRGIGTRLYGALFAILDRQGFHSLYGGISLPNPASVSLHAAMGMSDVGIYREVGFKLGSWRDVLWMGKTSTGDAVPHKPPTPFPALDPGWVTTILAR